MTTTRPARAWKPTRVQKDVLDRLADGWWLRCPLEGNVWMLTKDGEASRHVAERTAGSLIDRNLVRSHMAGIWVLA